jgi:rieske iron-sulfur protein
MTKPPLPRRVALGFGVTALIAPARSPAARIDDAAAEPRAGDLLVFARSGAVVAPEAMAADQPPVLAWAMEPERRIVRDRSRSGQILLLRVDAGTLSEAEIPFAANGIVAYSAICTHAGCLVSGWKPAEGHLLCPCHGSVYAPALGGRVIAGPAPRPLPALPLHMVGGALTIAAGFTARIGGYTGRTD